MDRVSPFVRKPLEQELTVHPAVPVWPGRHDEGTRQEENNQSHEKPHGRSKGIKKFKNSSHKKQFGRQGLQDKHVCSGRILLENDAPVLIERPAQLTAKDKPGQTRRTGRRTSGKDRKIDFPDLFSIRVQDFHGPVPFHAGGNRLAGPGSPVLRTDGQGNV